METLFRVTNFRRKYKLSINSPNITPKFHGVLYCEVSFKILNILRSEMNIILSFITIFRFFAKINKIICHLQMYKICFYFRAQLSVQLSTNAWLVVGAMDRLLGWHLRRIPSARQAVFCNVAVLKRRLLIISSLWTIFFRYLTGTL
jgi:hypothetical protein